MTKVYNFPDLKPIRILQITDPHLFAEEDGQLLGVPTIRSFQAVIDAILKSTFNYDFILATGDLVQDKHLEPYHRFAQLVEPLAKPLFWVEGNHDIQPQMGEVLAKYDHILPYKQILAGDKWQIILLDSHVGDMPKGKLSKSQLSYLAEKLSDYPDRYALIVLHHNILPTNSAWLDQHSLANADQLAEVLKPFPNVKAILHGHIHQEVDQQWQGYRILSTPATCVQFKPNCDDFTLDPIPQGWRELTLYPDGSIITAVKRLDCNDFLPNFNAIGY